MSARYDLVIVGGGPGGAMAAKTASEIGLKTALLERKTRPWEITRSCATMFAIESDHYFGERMYYNDTAGKMVFPVNGFTVDYDGPVRNFYAWHFHAPDGRSRLAFGDYEANRPKGNSGRLSFVYDKGRLLQGLVTRADRTGAEILTGVNVDGIEPFAQGVRVKGNGDTFEATFVIAADGLNSRVANLMGFNRQRAFYGASPRLSFYVSGVDMPCPETVNIATCSRSGALMPTWISPRPGGEYMIEVRSEEHFDFFTRGSVFAPWFRDMKVLGKSGYVMGLRPPVEDPCRDNVLLVGDAAWFAEAEITGSMMCGWKAAHTVALALRDNKPDRQGVMPYIDWWKRSYPGFEDYRHFVMTMLFMNGVFGEAELNYIYGLLKEPLPANLNPFRVVRTVKKALEPMQPQIQREMPSVIAKLEMLEIEHAGKLLETVKEKLQAKENPVGTARERTSP